MSNVVLIGGTQLGSKIPGWTKHAAIYRLGAVLEQREVEVRYVDHFEMTTEADREKIITLIDDDTVFVGVSTTLLSSPSGDLFGIPDGAFQVFMQRILSLNVCTIVGGASVYRENDSLQRYAQYFDYFVEGDGEIAIEKVYDSVMWGLTFDVDRVHGMKFVRSKPYTGFNRDVLVTHEKVFEPEDTQIVEFSRGCIFSCRFCKYSIKDGDGKRISEKPSSDTFMSYDVLRELFITNHERFGTTNYFFADSIINDSYEKVETLARALTSLPFKPQFAAHCRIEFFNKHPEMMVMLKEAGMVSANFGIETMHRDAGLKVGKGLGWRADDMMRKVREGFNDEIIISCGFIVGLPGEPIESIEKTVEYLMSADCPVDSAILNALMVQPERGRSDMDRNPIKYGIKIIDRTFETDIMSKDEINALRNRLNRKLLAAKPYNDIISPMNFFKLFSLGYTMNDVFSWRGCTDTTALSDIIADISAKAECKRNTYFERLGT